MKSINVLYYATAFFAPIIGFVWIGQNANERNPFLVWVVCILLFAGAGLLSLPGKLAVKGKTGGKIKWLACSIFVGILEAIGLIYAV